MTPLVPGVLPGLRLRRPEGGWPLVLPADLDRAEADDVLLLYQSAVAAPGLGRAEVAWLRGLPDADAALLDRLVGSGLASSLLVVIGPVPVPELEAAASDPRVRRLPHHAFRTAGTGDAPSGVYRQLADAVWRRLEEIYGDLCEDAEPIVALTPYAGRFESPARRCLLFASWYAEFFRCGDPERAARTASARASAELAAGLLPDLALTLAFPARGLAIPGQLAAEASRLRGLGLLDGAGALAGWALGLADPQQPRGAFPTEEQQRRARAHVRRAFGAAGIAWLGAPDESVPRSLEEAAAAIEAGDVRTAERHLAALSPDAVLLTPPAEANDVQRDRFLILAACIHLIEGRDDLAEQSQAALPKRSYALGPSRELAAAVWALASCRGTEVAWAFVRSVEPKWFVFEEERHHGYPILDHAPTSPAETMLLDRLINRIARDGEFDSATERSHRARICTEATLRYATRPARVWATRLARLRANEAVMTARAQIAGLEWATRLLGGVRLPDVHLPPLLPSLTPHARDELVLWAGRLCTALGRGDAAADVAHRWSALSPSPPGARARRFIELVSAG